LRAAYVIQGPVGFELALHLRSLPRDEIFNDLAQPDADNKSYQPLAYPHIARSKIPRDIHFSERPTSCGLMPFSVIRKVSFFATSI
jgi:hypothetical protein